MNAAPSRARTFLSAHRRLATVGVAGLLVFFAFYGRAFMGAVRPQPLTRDVLTARALDFCAAEGWSSADRLAWTYPVEGRGFHVALAAAAEKKAPPPDRESLHDPGWETVVVSNPRSIGSAIPTLSLPDPILALEMTPQGEVTAYLEISSPVAGQPIPQFNRNRELPLQALDTDPIFTLSNDRTPLAEGERERALATTREFFARHGIENSSEPLTEGGKDGKYSVDSRLVFFTWEAPGPLGMVDTTRVIVSSSRVAGYERTLKQPGASLPPPDAGVAVALMAVIPIIVILGGGALIAVMVIIRRRQGELDVRSATTVFLVHLGITLLLFASYFGATVGIIAGMAGHVELWFAVANIFVTMPIIAAVIALVVAGAWAAGEGQAYVVWPQHFLRPYSAFLRGHFRTAEAGEPVAAGYLFAFAALGAVTLLGLVTPPSSLGSVAPIMALGYKPIVVALPLLALSLALTMTVAAGIFAMTYVRVRTRRIWVVVLVGTFVMVGIRSSFTGQQYFPGAPAVATLVSIALAVAACIVFVRYGPVAMGTAIYAFVVVGAAYPLVLAQNPGHASSGVWSLLIAFAPAAVASYGVYRPHEHVTAAVPRHVRRALDRLRIGEEFAVARNVQMRLLPEAAPAVPGLDVAGLCVPANEVGGDYYDYFVLADGRLGIAVGDVSGKGVGAAIYMTLTKSYMVTQAPVEPEPVRVLARVNEHLRRNLARGTFVTMVYGVVDAERGRLAYARAGHNPPLLVRAGGDGDFLNAPGVALGAVGRATFEHVTRLEEIELLPGDLVVFYTDGVTEAMNLSGEEFGEERLIGVVRSVARHATPAGVVDALLREVRAFAGRAPQHDDITIVAVRVLEASVAERAE